MIDSTAQVLDDISEHWESDPNWKAEAIPAALASAVVELADAVRDAGNAIAEAIRETR